MKCDETRKHLNKWVDKELDSATNVRVSEHLETCPFCAAEAYRLQKLASLLENLPVPAGSTRLAADTLNVFKSEVAAESLSQWWGHLNGWMRGAVCTVAVAGLLAGVILANSLQNITMQTPDQESYVALLDDSDGGLL